MNIIQIFFFIILEILSTFENPVTVVALVAFVLKYLQNALLLNIYISWWGLRSLQM